MNVLFDTNVVLDVLLDREPFAADASELMSRVESGDLVGFLGATTLTTIHYLSVKAVGRQQAIVQIRKLLQIFEIAPVNRAVLESATGLAFRDFEDAVLHEAAVHAGARAIVTRNALDFKAARLEVYTAVELVRALHQPEERFS